MRALLLRFFKFVRFGWKLLLFWFLSIVAFGTWAAINAWLAPDVPNNRHFDGAFYHFVIGGFAGFYIGPCVFVLYHALGFVVNNCLQFYERAMHGIAPTHPAEPHPAMIAPTQD